MKKIVLILLVSYANCFAVDGQLDPTFGSSGLVVTPVNSSGNEGASIFSIAIQADQKIVAGGFSNPTGHFEFALARYNTDGSLDTSFNSSGSIPGIVFTSVNGTDDEINDVIIQPDGKIVVTGLTVIGSITQIVTARYNTDGSLDTSFGSGGIVTTSLSGSALGIALALQPDGKIVVVGPSIPFGEQLLVRYYSNGALDDGSQGGSGFGTGGIVTSTIFGSNGNVSDVAITNTGQILMSGTIGVIPNRNFAIARFNADGTLDATFGVSGLATTTLSDDAQSTNMRLQPDGKIVIIGTGPINTADFIVARFYPNGVIDNGSQGGAGFGTSGSGTVITDLGGNDSIFGVAIQEDGKIVCAGFTIRDGFGEFVVVRYTTAGLLDTATFNPPQGFTETAFSGSAQAFAIALQIDGKIVIAGTEAPSDGIVKSPSDPDNFALARYLAQPNLNPTTITFPTNGSSIIGGSFTITGTAENPSNVGIFLNGEFIGLTSTIGSSNTWSFTLPLSLANGTYSLQAVAEYTSGNVNIPSDPVTFSIVNPVTPVITTPTGCSIQMSPVQFSGTSDPNAQVLIKINGVTFTTTSSSTGFWSTSISLAPGNYTAIIETQLNGAFSNPVFVNFFVRGIISPLVQALIEKYCCQQNFFF